MTACNVDVTPPGGSQVSCSRDTDCPETFFCSESLGRCISNGGDDTPPAILQFGADRVRVGADVEVTLTFSVNENLREEPLVEIGVEGSTPRNAALSADNGLDYTFTYTVASTDAQGSATVTVSVTDDAGLTTQESFEEAFVVETTPPTLLVQQRQVTAAADNILITQGLGFPADAEDAAAGSTVTVNLSFDEELATAPMLTAIHDGTLATESFGAPTSDRNPLYTFSKTVTTQSDGHYTLTVSAEDLAGNIATLELDASSAFAIDTTAPAAPHDLLFTRVPWGRQQASAAPENAAFYLESLNAQASVEAGATMLVFDEGQQYRLGPPIDAGSGVIAPTRLLTADRVAVLALAIDAAGNASAPTLVSRGQWVATLKGKIAGNELSNPSRVTTLGVDEPALFSPLSAEPPSAMLARLGSRGESLDASLTLNGTRRWKARAEDVAPAATSGVMAHMNTSGRTYFMLGTAADETQDGVWEWDGVSWQALSNAGVSPEARIGSTAAYDVLRDRVVLFGGAASFVNVYPDIWEWDGASWIDVTPTDTPLPKRAFSSSAFDSNAGVALVFGGLIVEGGTSCSDPEGQPLPVGPSAIACASNDLWAWDGITFSELCSSAGPCSTRPPPRHSPAMTFDAATGETILFGGWYPATDTDLSCPDGGVPQGASGSRYCALSDTWSWDGTDWTDVTPVSPGPEGRYGASMAFDLKGGKAVMVAGCKQGEFFECTDAMADVWEWSGSAWSERSALDDSGKPLPKRAYAGMVYDTARGNFIIAGGNSTVAAPNPLGPDPECGDTQSTPGIDETVVCDGGGDAVKKHGGIESTCSCDQAGTWILLGTLWQRVASPSGSPEVTAGPGLAYDPNRQRAVLFGGSDRTDNDCDGAGVEACGTLWEWDGVAWQKRAEPTAVDCMSAPPELDITPREDHAFAYLDNGTGGGFAVSFGGRAAGSPLFCGCDQPGTYLCSATWGFDGDSGTWNRLSAGIAPAPRYQAKMASAGTSLYLYGGIAPQACDLNNPGFDLQIESQPYCLYEDTWKLTSTGNDAVWSRVHMGDIDGPHPGARYAHAMTYDAVRDRIMLFGGCDAVGDSSSCLDDTHIKNDLWEFDPTLLTWTEVVAHDALADPLTRPSIRADFSFVFDSTRGRSIVFAGGSDGTSDNFAWEWNGVDSLWQLTQQKGLAPSPTRRLGGLYDTARSKMLIVGGGRSGDFWEWNLDVSQRPAARFEFAFDRAAVDTSSVLSLALEVVADSASFGLDRNDGPNGAEDSPADGDSVAAPHAGLEISGWNWSLSSWDNWLSVDDSVVAPGGRCSNGGVSTWTCAISSGANDYIAPGDGRIYVRLRPPRGIGNGASAPTLNIDYVELRVDYDG